MTETSPPNEWGLVVLCGNCKSSCVSNRAWKIFSLNAIDAVYYQTYQASDIQWRQLQSGNEGSCH